MSKSVEHIAKLLRTPKEVVFHLEEKMRRITGKKNVFDKIYQEIEEKVDRGLRKLRVSTDAREVYQALIDKAKENDHLLFNLFRQPKFNTTDGCRTLVNVAKETAGDKRGFFLSLEKAKELLKLNPPQNVIKYLGYKTIDEVLAKEDILEVFSALRFAEPRQWLNDVFFRPYYDLEISAFEKRTIEIRVLSEKWAKIAAKFTGKKLHNISHLKELGVIFVIPYQRKFIGQTIELFTLLLHYIHEIGFYSRVFQLYSRQGDQFGAKMASALRGDVGGLPLPDDTKMTWRIIQRYLAKDDPNDARLFETHINPEAIHWSKAEKDAAKLNRRFPELGLDFWESMDVAGDYFPLNQKEKNGELLISFDLIDNIISLGRNMTVVSKYLYHQQEALWNRIFIEYLGEKELERLSEENLAQGYVSLTI